VWLKTSRLTRREVKIRVHAKTQHIRQLQRRSAYSSQSVVEHVDYNTETVPERPMNDI
jgi:hypothetical protein